MVGGDDRLDVEFGVDEGEKSAGCVFGMDVEGSGDDEGAGAGDEAGELGDKESVFGCGKMGDKVAGEDEGIGVIVEASVGCVVLRRAGAAFIALKGVGGDVDRIDLETFIDQSVGEGAGADAEVAGAASGDGDGVESSPDPILFHYITVRIELLRVAEPFPLKFCL